jgi:valyl-tRNA synthetase
MPHIVEQIYLAGFAATDGARSIHVSRWPQAPEVWASTDAARTGQTILEVVEHVRRWKADRKLSVGAPVAALRISSPNGALDALREAQLDLRSVTRAERVELVTGPEGSELEVAVEAKETGPA